MGDADKKMTGQKLHEYGFGRCFTAKSNMPGDDICIQQIVKFLRPVLNSITANKRGSQEDISTYS